MEEATYNFYFNTVEEFKAPFLNENSVVYQEGLRLVSLETEVRQNPFKERVEECATGGTLWHRYLISIPEDIVTIYIYIHIYDKIGELVSETSQLRILHSTEEDSLSPFDSKIACLCQSIEIN